MKNNIVVMSQKGWKDLKITSSFEDLYQNAIRARHFLRARGDVEVEVAMENIRRELYLRINSFLLKNKMVTEELLRCCVYVSKIAEEIEFLDVYDNYFPELPSFDINNRMRLKETKEIADGFFVACAVFPEVLRRDGLSLSECTMIGESLYWRTNGLARNRIYMSMSHNFDSLVKITRGCLLNTFIKVPDSIKPRAN